MLCFTALDLIGALLCGRQAGGIRYLAVGTGDPAWDAQPPPADRSRTGLTAEVFRIRLRPGTELSYDAVAGAVDVRISLGPGVATGPLREVGLFGGPATAAPGSGLLVSHKAHDRIDKGEADTVDRELRLQLAAPGPQLLPGARDLIGGLLAGVPGVTGLAFGALGRDGSAPAAPPAGLVAEAFRIPLRLSDTRYDSERHEVVATLSVPFTAGPELAAEAGLFGGAATPEAGTGLLVQRQVFGPLDRTVPVPILRRFTLSLVSATAVTVPDVTGSPLADARAALAAADLLPGPVRLVDGAGAAVGAVTAQQPAAGGQVAEGTTVELDVAAEATVAVPGVIGLPLATATAAITAVGLVAGDPEQDETDDPRGSVVAVRPEPGTLVPAGSTVIPTVATPPVREVPDVVGRMPEAARVLLAAAGFRLTPAPFEVLEGGSTAGTVVGQSPAARSRAAIDQPVSITVAAPWAVDVPDLTGKGLDDAVQALRDAAAGVLSGLGRPADPPGLTLGSTSERPAATGEQVGTVTGQQPAAGTRAPLFSAVSVVLAGSVRQPVPDLSGLPLGAAAAALNAAGFVLGAVAHRAADIPAGTVVDQDPDPGSTWPPAGRVSVSVSVPLTVLVPDLAGLDHAAAVEGLTSRGLVAGALTSVATGPGPLPGQVMSQDPAAGTPVDKGSAVALTVAAGMPDLTGRPRDDALAAVTAIGLSPVVEEQPDDASPGTVIGQTPAAGAPTVAGQQVTIVVAVPRPVTVPDVTGEPFVNAQAELLLSGLNLLPGGSREQAGVPAGTVLALDPPAGTQLPPGSVVLATLSVLPPVMVDVPSLVGRQAATARQLVTNAGLAMVVGGSRPAPGTPAETVLAQNPPAGTSVLQGSVVTVVVAAVDTSVLVPDLRSLPSGSARAVAAATGLGLAVTGTQLSLGPPDVVLSQDPLPNSRVPSGATVNVVLSAAAVRLPNMVGLDIDNAADRLEGLNLQVRRVARRLVQGDGSVISQLPAAGTVLAAGSLVTLTYSIEIIRPHGPQFPQFERDELRPFGPLRPTNPFREP